MFQFNVPMPPPRLDPIDDQLLTLVRDGKTLVEMGNEVGRSFAGVRKRLKALEEAGYVQYNPGHAKARMLTPLANEYLRANGLVQQEIFVK